MVFPMPICYVKRKLDHKKVNKKTEKEIPHDGEIKEVKEMSIEEKKPSVEQIMNRFSRCNTADVGEPGFGNNNYIKEVKE